MPCQRTSSYTDTSTEHPDIETLSNTRSIDAVRENTLSLTGILFYESGKLGEIETSEPLTIVFRDNGDEFTLSISYPTQKLRSANITVSKQLVIVDKDEEINSKCDKVCNLDIDFTNAHGKTVTAKF